MGRAVTPANWQPIDTAPRDGTEILLTVNGETRLGFWHQAERDPGDPKFKPGAPHWLCYPSGAGRYDCELEQTKPTAWAPVPPPLTTSK